MGLVHLTFTDTVPAKPAAVLIQPDGKFIVVSTIGAFNSGFGANLENTTVALALFNPDGSLDTTFGSGGRATTTLGGPGGASATSAVLLPDGSILVTGTTSSTNTAQLALARYTPDGQLDSSFGTGGIQVINLSGVTYDNGRVVLKPDGKLIVPALAANGGATLIRLNPDGSLDASFVAAVASLAGVEPGLVLQGDGKILLSIGPGPNGSPFGFAFPELVRFNPNGSLDTTFGNGGIAMMQVYGKVNVQVDGRILVLGPQPLGGGIERVFTNGNPDTTFGVGGEVRLELNNDFQDLAVQPDNKILLAGDILGSAEFILERLDPNGSPDLSFGMGAKAYAYASQVNDPNVVLALQPDGRIIGAGEVSIGQQPGLGVARFLGDSPITDNNQRFVTHLYLDLLERSPDSGGLTTFTTALNQNQLTRMQVVQAITSSVEYHTLEVQNLYGRFLGRSADPAGLANWVSFLSQGGTEEQLEAILMGSAEYFSSRGASISGTAILQEL